MRGSRRASSSPRVLQPSPIVQNAISSAIGGTGGAYHAHDPSGTKLGEWYYAFSTDTAYGWSGENIRRGLQIRRSKDLIDWEFVGWVFDEQTMPKYMDEFIPSGQRRALQGAEGVHVDGEFRLYYCKSGHPSDAYPERRIMVGMSKSKSITGPWTHVGPVLIRRGPRRPWPIGPNVVRDARGGQWITFGTGGILNISRLRPDGTSADPTSMGKVIARHRMDKTAKRDDNLEGPEIYYHPRYKKYYLFVSYGWFNSTYHVSVARSEHIDGPYVDPYGQRMDNADIDAGLNVLNSYAWKNHTGWVGPGHCDIIDDGDAQYMLYHVRENSRGSYPTKPGDWFHLQARKITWIDRDGGWPVVGPGRYAGEEVQPIPASAIPGEWETLVLPRDIGCDPTNGRFLGKTRRLVLCEGGYVGEKGSEDRWKLDGNTLTIKWKRENRQDVACVLASWDWENDRPALVFTGLTHDMLAFWGKKRQ